MRWGRVLLAGIGSQVVVLVIITLATSGYAFQLAFKARGAPDQARIAEYAEHTSRSSWAILQVLVTAVTAAWTLRRFESSQRKHGILIGLVAAVAGSVVGFKMSLGMIADFGLTVGAGWLGGAMIARRQWLRGHRR